jgi:hypothetical protein
LYWSDAPGLQPTLIYGDAAVGVSVNLSRTQNPFLDGGVLPETPSSAIAVEEDNRLQQTLFGVEKLIAARHSYWLYLREIRCQELEVGSSDSSTISTRLTYAGQTN